MTGERTDVGGSSKGEPNGGADRAQAYTLEGLVAAILIASAVLYGLQAVDVAPYTEDRSDRDLDAFRTQVDDALGVLGDDGELRRAVTCLGNGTGQPHLQLGQPPDGNASDGDGNVTNLGYVLSESLGQTNRQYIVIFDYWNESVDATNSTVIYPNGTGTNPSFTREPVTATHRVTLYDSSRVHRLRSDPRPNVEQSCRATSDTVDDLGRDFYLPETSPDTREIHNTVTVRVIAW